MTADWKAPAVTDPIPSVARPSESSAALVARPDPALISAEGAACAPSKAVCVRFAPDEYARLAAVAAERHMSIPEVLRLSWSLIERLEASHV